MAKTTKQSAYKEPIDYIIRPLYAALGHGAATGILLFSATLAALIVANSSWGAEWYHHFWEHEITISYDDHTFSMNLHHFVNDGLMAIFFFLVGLEIKQEFLLGQLSTWRKAALPIGAAIGGMVVPAFLFILFTAGSDSDGWGIPMATDIAFTLGLINLVKNRVAKSVKVFVTSLAVVDDIGAVLVIALFYTSQLHIDQLYVAAACLVVLAIANKIGVRSVLFYSLVGIGGIWFAFFFSGIHPTIAGILMAFTIPAKSRISKEQFKDRARQLFERYRNVRTRGKYYNTPKEEELLKRFKNTGNAVRTPLQKISTNIHGFVYFVVMPIFAFANAGLHIDSSFFDVLLSPIAAGVIFGLLLGKVLGITFITRLLVALKISQLPIGATWRQVIGVSILAGIGFTMSLFISELAYSSETKIEAAKSAILVASTLAAVVGLLFLRYFSDYNDLKSQPQTIPKKT